MRRLDILCQPLNLSRIWKAGGLCSHILEGHSGAITSVSTIGPKGDDSVTDLRIATASKDHTLRLWKFDAGQRVLDHPMKIRAFKILQGHKSSIQSVAAQPSGDMVCSGSWDCTINLWQTNESDTEGDLVSVKKRKMGSEAEESQLQVFILLFSEMKTKNFWYLNLEFQHYYSDLQS
uniref:Uncharacterized protein n=1 Tax=Nelumbo nucifera TaxID=4432 RepID=A0A822YG87_NELNU|nr:TPA_asm: hypothetical protein HUJ06_010293 [Nelumbo nucifera]